MRRTTMLLRMVLLPMCVWAVMTMASAYGQCTCDPAIDGAAETACYAGGGSWDSSSCTCSGGCSPEVVYQCAQQGGTLDASCICQGAYDPCSQIIAYYEVYFASYCSIYCYGCNYGDICCWADAIYQTYGMGGVYCGLYYVTGSFLGCQYSSYLSECSYLCSGC